MKNKSSNNKDSSQDMASQIIAYEAQVAQMEEEASSLHARLLSLHKASLLGEKNDNDIDKVQSEENALKNRLRALHEIIVELKKSLVSKLSEDRKSRQRVLSSQIDEIRQQRRELEKEKVAVLAKLDVLNELITGRNALAHAGRFELPEDNIFFRDQVVVYRQKLNPKGNISLESQRHNVDRSLIAMNKGISTEDLEKYLEKLRG